MLLKCVVGESCGQSETVATSLCSKKLIFRVYICVQLINQTRTKLYYEKEEIRKMILKIASRAMAINLMWSHFYLRMQHFFTSSNNFDGLNFNNDRNYIF